MTISLPNTQVSGDAISAQKAVDNLWSTTSPRASLLSVNGYLTEDELSLSYNVGFRKVRDGDMTRIWQVSRGGLIDFYSGDFNTSSEDRYWVPIPDLGMSFRLRSSRLVRVSWGIEYVSNHYSDDDPGRITLFVDGASKDVYDTYIPAHGDEVGDPNVARWRWWKGSYVASLAAGTHQIGLRIYLSPTGATEYWARVRRRSFRAMMFKTAKSV